MNIAKKYFENGGKNNQKERSNIMKTLPRSTFSGVHRDEIQKSFGSNFYRKNLRKGYWLKAHQRVKSSPSPQPSPTRGEGDKISQLSLNK
jgi:hypothetical protein